MLLKPLDESMKRRLSLASERESGVIVRHLGFGIAPGEAKEAMGRDALHSEMRRVVDPYDGTLVVTLSERPAYDFLERDRVQVPTDEAAPCKEDSAIRDNDGAASDEGFPRSQLGTEHCLPFRLAAVRPFSDTGLTLGAHVPTIAPRRPVTCWPSAP